ncbi:MAG: hypothetical protein ACFE7E_05400 [Candidatus Hodarchaeota archaeon]
MVRLRKNDEEIIKAIYIFSEEGDCLAKYTTLPEGKLSLTIINTLDNLTGNLENSTANDSQRNVSDRKIKMYQKSKQNITVALICSKKLPEKAAGYLLDNISHKFINMYSGKLETQNGNSGIYEGFQQILEGCCYSAYLKILMKEFSH